MATKKTVNIPIDEIRERLASPEAGSALIETSENFTGGTLQPVIEQQVALQAQAVQPDPVFTLKEKIDAARKSTVTNFLSDAIWNANQDPEFIDFDPTLDAGGNARKLLREYGIPETDETLQAMGKGGTAGDQAEIASRLAKHQFDLDVLGQHGVMAFTAAMVDPATLIVDLATFGTTKALKLGRTASALAGAAANTTVVGAADVAGKETTAFDYAITAALSGGAFALFGGQAANNIKSGGSNWYGKLQNPNTGKVTAFFSEADKVAPHAASREVAKAVVDDPLRREEYFSNSNAAAVQRKLDNITEGGLMEYDNFVEDTLRQQGFSNKLARSLDLGGSYTAAKSAFNLQVMEDMLRRNDEFLKFGQVYSVPPTAVTKAADKLQEIADRTGQTLKQSGVAGFENFTPQPGYVPRVWQSDKIRRIGKKDSVGILTQSIRSGLTGIDPADAGIIARAVVDRALAKGAGFNVDFMGGLGKVDTDAFKELLEAGGLTGAALDSATQRLDSLLDAKGKPKFARSRLPLDMTVSYRRADGTRLRMTDLIDTDVDRIMRNYTSTANGRSALAVAGVGKNDKEIGDWLQKYEESISDLPADQYADALEQMQGIIGDYTGNIPAQNILGPNAQRASALAYSTMLAAQAVWQGTEYASIAHRFGFAATAKEFFKQFPGVKGILTQMNGHPDLVDEMKAVLNLDLTRDVRFKQWMQQHDAFLTSRNSWVDRALHFGKQALPFITGQKYVHSHQVRMSSNLAIIAFGKAMKGDTEAMTAIQSYGKDVDWSGVFARNAQNVTYYRDIPTQMNWGLWAAKDVDTVMDTVLRYVDDAVLHGRTGQGSGFARSQTGQVLGQFRSFVTLAHNKSMRGTIHNQGSLAFAQLLMYQYPLTVLMVALNEARKGTLDVDSDTAIQDLAKKALGYTAGLGFYADAANTIGLTGGRGGLSVPLLGATQAPYKAIQGMSKQFDDDTTNDDETLYDVTRAASMLVPAVIGIPGTAMAIEAMKPQK